MTSDLNFSLSITYVTMLFLPVNGCISIKFPIPLRDLFWGSSLQHPQTLLGFVRTSHIQSLTLEPVLADPASWWMEEEGSGAQSGGSTTHHQLAGSDKAGLKVRDWMQMFLHSPAMSEGAAGLTPRIDLCLTLDGNWV